MKTVIVNAHVISPGVDIPCAAVEIADGKIVKVATAAKPGKNDWVFDAKGAYVLPGFIGFDPLGAYLDVTAGNLANVLLGWA